jgi:hypothetical protein
MKLAETTPSIVVDLTPSASKVLASAPTEPAYQVKLFSTPAAVAALSNAAVGLVLRILIKHLGDEVEFSALTPHIGVKGRIHGEGLNLVAKTLAKYMK